MTDLQKLEKFIDAIGDAVGFCNSMPNRFNENIVRAHISKQCEGFSSDELAQVGQVVINILRQRADVLRGVISDAYAPLEAGERLKEQYAAEQE